MQVAKRIYIFAGVVTAAVGLFTGCATGPRYAYTQQEDSASVEGPIGPTQGPENGSSAIVVVRLDGLNTGFIASHPGLNWPFNTTSRLYVAPGMHALTLSISEIETTNDPNVIGDAGAFVSGAAPTITAEFLPQHVYRFAAYLTGKSIDLVLWDETGGSANRSRAANWTLNSNRTYSENPAPSGK